MRLTPLARLIGHLLERDLREFVVEARNAGKGWRTIAAEITEKTGQELSGETLRAWFADELTIVLRDATTDTEAVSA